MMIKNYFKTAVRSLMKNKGFTIINVLGLALGLVTCLLIVFYVFDESRYDTYNTKLDRIYRINYEIKFGGNANTYAIAPAPAAGALKGDFPEIEQVARFRYIGGNQVKKGNQNIQEDRMVYADNSIFDLFTLPMMDGKPANALTAAHTVVITERMAKKYFARTDVVGQVLTFNDTALYTITGVIDNMPEQSHFHFDFFISMPTLAESRETSWLDANFNTYILLKPGANYKSLVAKFPDFMKKHSGPELQDVFHVDFGAFEKSGNYFRFNLIPLAKIHLESNSVNELGTNGDIVYVYIFFGIAIFILIIACVNFMNLSTARSANRAREVGVRKVLGAARKYLIAQFLAESVLVTLAGALIAVLVGWLFLPVFNQMSGKALSITPKILGWLIPVLITIILVVGCLAGFYPAFVLSGFQPIQVLKGKLAAGFRGSRLRSFLVVFQFSISIFLIIGTLVIYNQLQYIQNRDIGYNRDHVLIVKNVAALGNNAQPFKQEIKRLAGVENATLSGSLPTIDYDNSTTYFKEAELDPRKAILTQQWNVDEDYINTLKIKMAAGRNFSKDMSTDSAAIIINESFAKLLDFSNPIGQFLYTPAGMNTKNMNKYHIIGVMKNFNFRSVRNNITPILFNLSEDRSALDIRINSENIPSLLTQVNNKWNAFSPNQQFSYAFMDQQFDALYRSEQRIGNIFISFTLLAITIACLGLFGLTTYAAEQRTKEIGIRKVLGATLLNIVKTLSKDFIKLVLIAIVIATPFAWLAMHSWLQGFAYRQAVAWWVPALAAVMSVLIALITVSFQSIKASLTNPVKSLRNE